MEAGLLRELYSHFTDNATRHEVNYTFMATLLEFEKCADAEKVETMVLNLHSNAFKFTPKGGDITLDVETINTANPDDHVVQICVTDTGVVISSNDQKRIFERFAKLPNQEKRKWARVSDLHWNMWKCMEVK